MALPTNVTASDIVNYLAALAATDVEAFALALTEPVIAGIAPAIVQQKITGATAQMSAAEEALTVAQTNLAALQES